MVRLRRAWAKGPTPGALAVAERFAGNGMAEAQHLLAGTLYHSEVPGAKEAAIRWYTAAANQGHAEACRALWVDALNEIHQGHKHTLCHALPFLRQWAAAGDARASRMLLVLAGDITTATEPDLLKYLHRHADLGEADAQRKLGFVFDEGLLGVQRDPERAFSLYLAAAKQGDRHAQCCVGILYAYGIGVAQNDELAVHWYQFAARGGSAQAQYNLGYSYEIGRSPLEQSTREANRWYRRAAMRDFSMAQHNLGLNYFHGRELPQNQSLAVRWYARAAEQGYARAQCALGFAYECGFGVEVSHTKAVALYAAAAQSGDAQAQQNYAHMLENGLGVAKDVHKSFEWYRTAAEQGLASAQSCLAWMYENGVGVGQDLEEALALYTLSAAQSDERGIEGLERLSWGVAVRKGCSDLKVFLERMSAADPLFEAKYAILKPMLKPAAIGQLQPSKWADYFEAAYNRLSEGCTFNPSE